MVPGLHGEEAGGGRKDEPAVGGGRGVGGWGQGVLPDCGPLSPLPSPKEPSGVSGLGNQQREAQGQEKDGGTCVWPTVNVCDYGL